MAESLVVFRQRFDDQLTCAVCLDQYTSPKTLPCQHSFCLECIRKLPSDKQGDVSQTTINCPTCRIEHPLPSEGGADKFPNAFHINSFLELKNDLAKTEADSISTSSEEPSTVGDNKASTCPLHNDPLRVYCETCDRLICRDCTISNEHKKHKYDLIVECYPKHHQQIEGELRQVKSKITNIDTAIMDLTNRETAVDEQGERLTMEIHQHAQQLIDIIHESERQLIQQVGTITQHKKEFLAKQKEAAGNVHSQLKTCEELIERNLREMSQGKVLMEKQAMIERMKKTSEHVDPATFVPIEAADSKFVKSLKNCDDSIGKIESSTCDNVKLEMASKGKKSSISLTVSSHDKSPFHVPVSAISLVTHSLDSSEPATVVNCDISHTSQHRGKYKITLPQVKRSPKVYKLAVKIGGFEHPTGCIMYDIAPVKTINLECGYHHLAICDNGDILATEQMNHSITALKMEGRKGDHSIGTDVRTIQGKYSYPNGLATTNDGFILLTDRHRLQKLVFRIFSGRCVKSVGSNVSGNDPLQFNDPCGIAVHPTTGQIFVAEAGNNRVQALNADLTFSHFIAPQDDQQFLWPRDVALDCEGYLYVTDNNCITKLTTTGECVTKFNSPGQSPGPLSITIGNNLVYVSENSNHCVSVFDTRGKFRHCFGKIGSGLAEFNTPRGIAVDKHGNVYISDFWNSRIVIY